MKGKFIVVEGGDGAGKDTQIELLKKDFPDLVYTREPGGTALGKEIREIVLHEKFGPLPLLTEALLFLADRAQHVHEVIEPAVASGKVVVSNRSWLSTIAYQVYGRNHHEMRPLIDTGVAHIYKTVPLDLALVLDIPPEVGLARQQAAGKQLDVMESIPMDARRAVRQGFLDVAQMLPTAKVIDANRSVAEVYAEVKKEVSAILAL